MKILSNIFISISFVLLLKCTNKISNYPTLNSKEEINIGFKPTGRIDISFGINFIGKDSAERISYLNDEGDLIFYNLKARNNSVISLKKYLGNNGTHNGMISGERLFLYVRDSMLLYEFRIDFSKNIIKDEKKYDLSWVWDHGKYIDRHQNGNTLFNIQENIFIGYQTMNPKTYYLDNSSYFKYELLTGNKSIYKSKTLIYPKSFLRGRHYNYDTHLLALNDSTLVYALNSTDSIYKIHYKNDEYILKGKIDGFSGFEKFNPKKTRDLAYVRKYSETTEGNFNLLKTYNNKHIIIIKHLAKKSINDVDQWGYGILNENLDMEYKGVFQHSISPLFCFQYKNGFLIFSKSLEKAYYYEIP